MPTISNPSANPQSMAMKLLFSPIQAEIAKVEQILREEMRNPHPFVDELVRYGNLLGGKRLRPALLLLCAKSTGGIRHEHCILGAVVEMIHTATLVHDDVLDEADMRRHLATVNSRWDNESSVLLGDYLFTHAFYLASTIDNVLGCRLIGKATNLVCEGELRQKGSRGNYRLTEAEYTEIIEGKTAELTAVSCRLGGVFNNSSAEVCDELDGFGRDLGIAFQIADDLLDVLGEESATGKSLGTDLEKQKPTLPIIRALQVASMEDRDQILALVTGSDRRIERLTPFLERYEAIEYARKRAAFYAERAKRRLDCLVDSEAKSILLAMVDFSIARTH